MSVVRVHVNGVKGRIFANINIFSIIAQYAWAVVSANTESRREVVGNVVRNEKHGTRSAEGTEEIFENKEG
jgi:hypothetical protein